MQKTKHIITVVLAAVLVLLVIGSSIMIEACEFAESFVLLKYSWIADLILLCAVAICLIASSKTQQLRYMYLGLLALFILSVMRFATPLKTFFVGASQDVVTKVVAVVIAALIILVQLFVPDKTDNHHK